MLDAIEWRYEEQMSWQEIADKLAISRQSLVNWRSTEQWRFLEHRWKQMLRTEARGDMAKLSGDALQVVYQLAHTAKSEYVRYMAASKLLDLNKLGDENEERSADAAGELAEFLKTLKARRPALNIGEIGPGGLLVMSNEAAEAEFAG